MMNRNGQFRKVAVAAAIAGGVSLGGCEVFQKSASDPTCETIVQLYDEREEEEVGIIVSACSSKNEQVRLAMRHMQNQDWPRAEESLRTVVGEQSADAKAWYMLGVVLEIQSRLDEALEAYRTANIHNQNKHDTGPILDAQERVQSRL